MDFTTIPRSRYLITFHENTQRLTFYLAGATQLDAFHQSGRQPLYGAVKAAIEEEGSYNVNGDVWHDINTEAMQLSIRLMQDGYYHIIGRLQGELGDRITELYYNLGEVDLGVIPAEHDFAQHVAEYYDTLPENMQQLAVNLNAIKFHAWGGNTILVSVSVQLGLDGSAAIAVEPAAVEAAAVASEATQLPAEDTGSRPPAARPARRRPVAMASPIYDMPQVPDLQDWQDTKNYILSNFAGLYFVRCMFASEAE